jgi:hypothetical protein
MGKYDALLEDQAAQPAPRSKYSALLEEDAPAEKPGMLARAGGAALDMGLGVVSAVGNTIDRFTTAPARAAIGEVQANREERGGREEGLGKFLDPEEYKDIGRFGMGYLKNFGSDPEKAPTPKETAESYGVPETALSEVLPSFYSETGEGAKLKKGGFLDPTASGTAGMAAEMAVPIPGKTAASGLKMGVKGTSKAAGMAASGAAKVVDAATGTKVAGKTVGSVKGAIKALGDSWDGAKEGLKATFGAKQADDYGKSLETAMKNGIDPKLLPESVEFGPNSIVTRSARVQAEGPLGQPMLEKFEQAKNQVRAALKKDVENLAGGAPLSKPQAGEVLREGFNAGVQRAFDDIEISHKAIIAEAPNLRLTQKQIQNIAPKLQKMEEWAKGKAETGLTNTAKGQGDQILRAIDKFRKKGESYAGSYEALKEIGDVAFKKAPNSMVDVPPDIAKFRELYGEINEALIETVDDIFPAGKAQALRDANAAMSKIYGDKGTLGRLGEINAAGEDLFSDVIKNGSTKEIQALKKYLAPEQLQAVKGAFLNDMIKLDPEGNFTFRATFNRLRDKQDIADALFEPGELDNYLDLLRLGDKFGNAVMSTSGTGASGAFGEFLKTSKNRLIDDPIAANRKSKARAIGFDIEEGTNRAAAKRPGPGPTMGFGPGGRFSGLPEFNPRAKAARAYSTFEEDDEE